MASLDSLILPIGEMVIISSQDKLNYLNFKDNLSPIFKYNELKIGETSFSRMIKEYLKKYFEGNPVDFSTIPIEIKSTPFQKRIYSLLREYPYGSTTTYGELARKYEKRYQIQKLSAQAVGGALKRNPVLLVIPCHRVLKSDGSLGGFSVGIERKQFLLNLENYGN